MIQHIQMRRLPARVFRSDCQGCLLEYCRLPKSSTCCYLWLVEFRCAWENYHNNKYKRVGVKRKRTEWRTNGIDRYHTYVSCHIDLCVYIYIYIYIYTCRYTLVFAHSRTWINIWFSMIYKLTNINLNT